MSIIFRSREEAPKTAPGRPSTFGEFWPFYLSVHRRKLTRAIHYVGTSLALLLILGFAVTLDWRLLAAAPVAGYGIAMPSHPLIESNRPATFRHPWWSLRADFTMLFLAVAGRLAPELRRAGVAQEPGA